MTKAGRALQKHGDRQNSIFPRANGSAANRNFHGQFQLDDVLTHPNSVVSQHFRPKYGDVIDIRIIGDRGLRFSRNGDFIMFLEP